MISVKNAMQVFHTQVIFNKANFTIEQGEHLAIVGRNGAGKTTLLHTMLGFIRLKKGKITMNGTPVHRRGAWSDKLSYLPEKFQLYQQLTVKENVSYFAATWGFDEEETERVLALTEMQTHREKKVHQLSKGMLQRVGLSIVLLGDPEYIILDEPASGLDPFGRKDIRNMIQQMSTPDRTILFSTHDMKEVEELASSVLYIHNQQITKMNVQDFLNHFEGSFSS
ncbi:ABC transporter ATP-binding protein [Virgibacillus sp. MSP4-1]|uniref:ABC transporter ATP-binding protein n=1 Tax=Virgibacillus sp. MSP4-1 TaxID=2700081 RepID=UPI0003A2BD9E|nr:ABC transporter ATP-binding protein [Virgibacillus sp. MSP4-1]QHS24168.1 ABC transporter ATP-binding protein [Virgibacillus sp. MSP4-1]